MNPELLDLATMNMIQQELEGKLVKKMAELREYYDTITEETIQKSIKEHHNDYILRMMEFTGYKEGLIDALNIVNKLISKKKR